MNWQMLVCKKRIQYVANVINGVSCCGECWTVKRQVERGLFEMWCWRRMLRILWTARRTKQSVLDELQPNCSLEALVLKRRLSYFGHALRSKGMELEIMAGKAQGERTGERQRIRLLGVAKETNKSLRAMRSYATQKKLEKVGPWGRHESETTGRHLTTTTATTMYSPFDKIKKVISTSLIR